MLSVAMTMVMAVGVLAGCGNGATGSKDELVIGGIGPVSGDAAIYGEAVKNGATLAFEEINEAGGINGMKVAFNFQDDECDNEKAVNAYNALKDKGAKIILGATTSGCTIAVAEKTAEDNMFQITPSGSAVDCVANDNAFRICFNDPNQGIASAQYIAQNDVAKKVAVIYDSSDVYSSGIFDKFVAEAEEQGLEIVAKEAFTSDAKTDFSVQLQKVKESGAELVFLPIYYQEAALILAQADKAGIDNVKWFGCDGLDGIINQLGDDAALAEGVMLLTPFAADAEDDLTQNFVKAYKEKYGVIPNQFAADAYDAAYAIKAAVEQAEVKDGTISTSDLCEKLKAAMLKITVDGVTGSMTWTADGEPTKDPKAMVIKDGAYSAL
ncbi:MAG: amino acid ABC transporter substrate-binding protein [Lachnospiraceae bacterium]|nr:amino acid ABC transporter substrate-binding protein [Lachnospiraceae bacterium]